MSASDVCIPPWMPALLDRAPIDDPVALLLRHSARGPLPSGEVGDAVPLTDLGERLARNLGEMLRGRLRRLHTSPVLRCVQTAELLNIGAGTTHEVLLDRLLGDPSIYVVDAARAFSNWQRFGHEGVIERLVSMSAAMPAMARPMDAAHALVRHLLGTAAEGSGLHTFVTHDLVLIATVAQMFGVPILRDQWPWFLEGALFWRSGGELHILYRGREQVRPFSDIALQ